MNPPVSRKGKVVQVDVDRCCAHFYHKDVLKERLGTLRSRFKKWTVNDMEHLDTIVGRYQNLAIRAMGGEDISDDLHDVHKLTQIIAPFTGCTGPQVVQETLLRWFGSLYETLEPKDL